MNSIEEQIIDILRKHLIIPWGDSMQPDNLLIEELANLLTQREEEVYKEGFNDAMAGEFDKYDVKRGLEVAQKLYEKLSQQREKQEEDK